jgi:hypothetical protein
MEGQLFECTWKKEGRRFRVWVRKRPRLSAKGDTFNQADKRLWSVIIDATGDGESVRVYDPPEPTVAPEIEAPPASTLDVDHVVRLLTRFRRRKRKPETLNTNPKIQRQFELRVRDHFGFLGELGFRPPRFSSKFDRLTGMRWTARFTSRKRTLEIDLGKAYKEYSNATDFEVNPRPVVDRWEGFSSNMYFGMTKPELMNAIAEFEQSRTLDEIMLLEFPIFAELFRGELRQLLTGHQWHDEYEFYRDRSRP